MAHVPVLLKEAIEYLNPEKGDVILDATFGGGGHAGEILKKIGESGKLIGMDQDKEMLDRLISNFQLPISKNNLILVNKNFRNLDKVVGEKIDGALFDLGFSSDQLDESGRGFSFQKDEPLLMTLKSDITSQDLTAREIVNKWGEKEIADVLYEYGEERYSRRIARAIVERRTKKAIETTFELVDVIRSSVPAAYRNSRRINCATRTFQALRIAVNDELNALKEGLEKAWSALNEGSRLVVISFHSLEDRIVKNFYRDRAKAGEAAPATPEQAQACDGGRGKILTKKPIVPAEEEIKSNPRSRSAKMRVIEKIL